MTAYWIWWNFWHATMFLAAASIPWTVIVQFMGFKTMHSRSAER